MESSDPRSLAELISSLTSELANLVRKESELVRTELAEKLSQATHAGMSLGIGAALLIGAFLVLLEALVLALSKIMDPLWASLVVGVVVGAVGFMMVRGAAKMVTPTALMPDRSARQLGEDAQLVKDQVT